MRMGTPIVLQPKMIEERTCCRMMFVLELIHLPEVFKARWDNQLWSNDFQVQVLQNAHMQVGPQWKWKGHELLS